MKVLNVIMLMDPVNGGGSVERTFQMNRFLARSGVECSILTTDSGLTAERISMLKDVEMLVLPCFSRRFYLTRLSYSKIKELVIKVDIVHLMNHWSFQNMVVYFLARRFHKPYVICAAGSLTMYGRSRMLKVLYDQFIGKKIIRNADFCIAITSDEVGCFKSYGVDLDKIAIIPNGVTRENLIIKDDALFRKKFGIGNRRIILFAGRLTYIKGPDLLLRAFCNLKDVLHDYQLVFIGPDAGMLPELEKIVDDNHVNERVKFLGYLDGADKSMAYNASGLLAIPSRKEAMSIVVLEAGVTGKPVLITDQCGFNRVAGVNGGKVVPASVEGLQQGLMELCNGAHDLRAMGDNLMKFVEENFLWDSLVGQYLGLYDRILRNRNLQRRTGERG